MEQHFVTFISPGTFFPETTTKPVSSWSLTEARRMVPEIVERHGATPHSFRFTTRGRTDTELDSKVTATSPIYYLPGGLVLTLEDVKARNDHDDRILISNMINNKFDRVIETSVGGWKSVLPLNSEDIVLEL